VNPLRLESRCGIGALFVAVKAIGVKSVCLNTVNCALVVTVRFGDESYNSLHIAKDPHLNAGSRRSPHQEFTMPVGCSGRT